MAFEASISILKRHPYAIGDGALAVFLLVYLYERSRSGSAPASTSDLSGGGNQVQALSAAADLTNAQTNAQVEVAAYQAGVAGRQVDAQLQTGLATTAAELQASEAQTAANRDVALGSQAASVTIAELQAEAAIEKTRLESSTVLGLASDSLAMEKVAASIPLAQIKEQQTIFATLAAKGKLGGDSTGVAQVVSAVYGEGPAAIAANQPTSSRNKTAEDLGAIGKIAVGLFG